jgi:hypothetical protein
MNMSRAINNKKDIRCRSKVVIRSIIRGMVSNKGRCRFRVEYIWRMRNTKQQIMNRFYLWLVWLILELGNNQKSDHHCDDTYKCLLAPVVILCLATIDLGKYFKKTNNLEGIGRKKERKNLQGNYWIYRLWVIL